MKEDFLKAVELVKKAKSIQVVTHMDADGLSAGGILSQALERLGKNFEITVVPGIYRENVGELDSADLMIFSDLGSGQLDLLEPKFRGRETIILDHHQPYGPEWRELVHINPCSYGLDGSKEISGSGVSYLFSVYLDPANKDLSKLAVVGAVGDIQNFWGKMESLNKSILEDAQNSGSLKIESDLLFFGRHTRPVYKTMQYFTDPFVPGISNSESGSISLLNSLNIPLKAEDSWRRLTDLTQEEKQRISSELIQRAMGLVPEELQKYIPSLVIGEVYTLEGENETPELKGVSEFSTCLNSTGRNDRPDIGLKIAQGKRGIYYKELMSLLARHRKNLAKALEFVEVNGIKTGPKNYVQYFDGGYDVPANIVGTIAGMSLGTENTDPYKPIVGFAQTRDGVKVSARCSRILVLQGIDMAKVIRKAAQAVNGTGGGHTVACGAFIPEGSIEKFVEIFEGELMK